MTRFILISAEVCAWLTIFLVAAMAASVLT